MSCYWCAHWKGGYKTSGTCRICPKGETTAWDYFCGQIVLKPTWEGRSPLAELRDTVEQLNEERDRQQVRAITAEKKAKALRKQIKELKRKAFVDEQKMVDALHKKTKFVQRIVAEYDEKRKLEDLR